MKSIVVKLDNVIIFSLIKSSRASILLRIFCISVFTTFWRQTWRHSILLRYPWWSLVSWLEIYTMFIYTSYLYICLYDIRNCAHNLSFIYKVNSNGVWTNDLLLTVQAVLPNILSRHVYDLHVRGVPLLYVSPPTFISC